MRTTPVDKLLESRGSTHGDWNETANLAQGLKDVMRSATRWGDKPNTHAEALDLIATKIARILSGDETLAEHWDDIIGYASLVARTLEIK